MNMNVAYEDVPKFDSCHDVIVCGYGGAGAAAALEASRHGARTLVLERASGGGGSTALSGGEMYLGGEGGTSLQVACGFTDSTQNMISYLTGAMDDRGDPAKIAFYCQRAADHFEWLKGLGITYRESACLERVVVPHRGESLLYTGNERAAPFDSLADPVPRGHVPSYLGDEGGEMQGGKLVFDGMRKCIEQLPVELSVDTQVLGLVVGPDRRVRGVRARRDNEEIFFEARRGVVLAMGGFVMNEGMVETYLPTQARFAAPYGNPWDRGDGIRMAMEAGAKTENMDEAFFGVYFYPPKELTYGIFVNSLGQRFVNEDSYGARIGYYCSVQPEQRVYLLVQNEDYGASLYMNGLSLAGVGDSIAEVEKEAGLPEGALEATVRTYNQSVASGRDDAFGKHRDWLKALDRPPFALIDYSFSELRSPAYSDKTGPLMFTLGGLKTLPTGAVLDANDEVIPGLYAAGRTTAGLPRTGKGYASGMSVGDATLFGREAGRSAACTTLSTASQRDGVRDTSDCATR